MSFKTDRARVTGLGSAKEGTGEWWQSRVTSAALVPLTLLFIFMVGPLIGEGYADVIKGLSHPVTAIVAILFIAVTTIHLAAGLHEIIIDYVHGKAALAISLVATKLLCWGIGAVGVFAIAKIAFTA